LTQAVLEHVYVPRGACKELFAAREPEVLLSGPAGTGKSRACLEKVHLMCLLNPGMKVLAVRKTMVSLSTTGIKTFERFVARECLANGSVTFFGGGPRGAAQYRYANGSTLTIGGMDKASRVMSSEYDVVYIQEATELAESDWEALTTRLRAWTISFQQVIADCNPDKPTHWLKARCDVRRTRVLESRHEDNPMLFDDEGRATAGGREYIAKLDALSGPRRLRLRHGIWAASEGLVHEGFDPAVHVLEGWPHPKGGISAVPPRAWPRLWSVDFGYTHPFVLQCWAVDDDGRLHLYRELFRTKRLVEDHAAAILKLVTYKTDSSWGKKGEWKEPRPTRIVCDHDAEGRATLERHLGMRTMPAHKAVTEGLQAVASRLAVAGDGKPRIYFYRNARVDLDAELLDAKRPTSTIEEFAGYVWDGSTDRPKETPLKVDDDGMDAMRYVVAYQDLAQKVSMRSI
jgi:phage terminase large subunit